MKDLFTMVWAGMKVTKGVEHSWARSKSYYNLCPERARGERNPALREGCPAVAAVA